MLYAYRTETGKYQLVDDQNGKEDILLESNFEADPALLALLKTKYGSGKLFSDDKALNYEYRTDAGRIYYLTLADLFILSGGNQPITTAIPKKCSAICNYDWIIGSLFVTRFMEDKKKYAGFHFSNCGVADLGIKLGDRFRIVGDTSGKIFTVKQFGHEDGTNTDTLVVTDFVLTSGHGIPSSGKLGILC